MSDTPPIWLLHGWAANRHVFDPLAERLQPAAVVCPNLPGHGNAAYEGRFDLPAIADQYAAQMPAAVHLLGWSLGGLIALHLAARHPHKVLSLCLTASFAKLQAAPNYPAGLNQPALSKMLPLFQQDYAKYIRQFIQLQFLYSKHHTDLQEAVLAKLTAASAPPALADALNALSQADARPLLVQIRCPTLLLFGDKDTLTPPRMGEYLQQHLPRSRLQLIPGAVHAPFLSHADEFAAHYRNFLLQTERPPAFR